MRWLSALALALTVLAALFSAALAASPTEGAPCDPKFATKKYNAPHDRKQFFDCVKIEGNVGEYRKKPCPEAKPMFNYTTQACTAPATAL